MQVDIFNEIQFIFRPRLVFPQNQGNGTAGPSFAKGAQGKIHRRGDFFFVALVCIRKPLRAKDKAPKETKGRPVQIRFRRGRRAAPAWTPQRGVPAKDWLKSHDELHEEAQRGRDAAFRRTILEIYDYRCAACGIRVLLESRLSLVEAAHLIPFNVSRNDRPDNGVALCPNHHWAMDRFLIAPCPDRRNEAGIWRVSPRLDDRIEGQKDLLALANRPVIPPSEEKFRPASDSLRWREHHLVAKY
jgi:hypothetical protein